MELKNKTILALGGAGLIGQAIIRRLLKHSPKKIIFTSLSSKSCIRAIKKLKSLGYDIKDKGRLVWKHSQTTLIGLSLNILPENADLNDVCSGPVHNLILKTKPEIIINTVTTSTALSYGHSKHTPTSKLTWLMQTMYNAMSRVNTKLYLKVGTLGTGGMGWNIPYSHGEGGNRPSNALCGKNQLAYSETGVMTIWSRYPQGPRVVELKPGTSVGFDTISKGPISWLHVPPMPASVSKMMKKKELLVFDCALIDKKNIKINWKRRLNGQLKGQFIRTGENGQFTIPEFMAITRYDQMGCITCEEVAKYAELEMLGKDTTYNYIQTAHPIPPSQLAGEIRQTIKHEMKNGADCPIYSNLGPPRILKLIAEAALLNRAGIIYVDQMKKMSASGLSKLMGLCVMHPENKNLVDNIVSAGIPIILPDGRLIVGPSILVPGVAVTKSSDVKKLMKNIDEYSAFGWIDLRAKKVLKKIDNPLCKIKSGMGAWIERAQLILDKTVLGFDLGSAAGPSALMANGIGISLDPGEISGWIMATEDNGKRFIS